LIWPRRHLPTCLRPAAAGVFPAVGARPPECLRRAGADGLLATELGADTHLCRRPHCAGWPSAAAVTMRIGYASTLRLRWRRSMVLSTIRPSWTLPADAEALAVSLAPTFARSAGWNHWHHSAGTCACSARHPALPRCGRGSAGTSRCCRRMRTTDLAPALNEAQMVLHAHPVNRAREAARTSGSEFAVALGRWSADDRRP
jgi:hypothetical protein